MSFIAPARAAEYKPGRPCPQADQGIYLGPYATHDQVRARIKQCFANPGRWDRIARCESGYEASARNGPNAGVLQVNVRAHHAKIVAAGYTDDDMFEVDPNLTIGLEISNGGRSSRAWACQ